MSNALHNITSLDRVIQEYELARKAGEKISDTEMEKIRNYAEELKHLFAVNYKKRNAVPTNLSENNLEDVKNQEALRQLQEKTHKLGLSGPSKIAETGLNRSSRIIDQGNIDASITKFKEGLSSDYARNILDNLIIGSLRSTNVQKEIDAILKTPPYKRTEIQKGLLKDLYAQGSKTGTSQLAYDSNAIDSKN